MTALNEGGERNENIKESKNQPTKNDGNLDTDNNLDVNTDDDDGEEDENQTVHVEEILDVDVDDGDEEDDDMSDNDFDDLLEASVLPPANNNGDEDTSPIGDEDNDDTQQEGFPWWYYAIVVLALVLICFGSWIYTNLPDKSGVITPIIPPEIQEQLTQLAGDIKSVSVVINQRMDEITETTRTKLENQTTLITENARLIDSIGADVTANSVAITDITKAIKGIENIPKVVQAQVAEACRLSMANSILMRDAFDGLEAVPLGTFGFKKTNPTRRMKSRLDDLLIKVAKIEIEFVAIYATADADTMGNPTKNMEYAQTRADKLWQYTGSPILARHVGIADFNVPGVKSTNKVGEERFAVAIIRHIK